MTTGKEQSPKGDSYSDGRGGGGIPNSGLNRRAKDISKSMNIKKLSLIGNKEGGN